MGLPPAILSPCAAPSLTSSWISVRRGGPRSPRRGRSLPPKPSGGWPSFRRPIAPRARSPARARRGLRMGLHAASALLGQVDRALWLVTARAGARRGGLIATFVCDASLVGDLPRALVGLARHHH